MMKTGNNNSKLLDSFVKAATRKPAKSKVEFDISKILKNNPKEPTLQEIFADVVKNGGKNITRRAQFGGGMDSMKPMPEPPVENDPMFDSVSDIGEPGLGEPGLGEPGLEDELGGELRDEVGGNDKDVKQHLVEALVSLCGSPEEAVECVTNQTMSPEGMPGDEVLEDDMGGLGDDMGGLPGEEADVPAPMAEPAPMPMESQPSPMPAPM